MGNESSRTSAAASKSMSEKTIKTTEEPQWSPIVRQISDITTATASSVQDIVMTSPGKCSNGPTIFNIAAKHIGSTRIKVPNAPTTSTSIAASPNYFTTPVNNLLVDLSKVAMQDLANHNLFLICMVLAYARALDETNTNTTSGKQMFAKKIVSMGLKLDLKPNAGRPYPSDIWDTWKLICMKTKFTADLYILSLEQDAAFQEFLYSILISESTSTIYVVFGTTDHRRLGQGMSQYPYLEQQVGVDGYWGDHILGRLSLVERLKRCIHNQMPKMSIQQVVLCGFGGGGALATIVGVLLTPHLPKVHIWTYGAPKVGDRVFHQVHVDLENQGRLYHIRCVNGGDLIPTQPLFSLDGWYWTVGTPIKLPISSDFEHPHSLTTYLRRMQAYKCCASLELWQEQEMKQQDLRNRKRQRRITFLACLFLTYGPLLYLKWNKNNIQRKAVSAQFENDLSVDILVTDKSLLPDLSTAHIEAIDIRGIPSATDVSTCLHCHDDTDIIDWSGEVADNNEPEEIERASRVAEEIVEINMIAEVENIADKEFIFKEEKIAEVEGIEDEATLAKVTRLFDEETITDEGNIADEEIIFEVEKIEDEESIFNLDKIEDEETVFEEEKIKDEGIIFEVEKIEVEETVFEEEKIEGEERIAEDIEKYIVEETEEEKVQDEQQIFEEEKVVEFENVANEGKIAEKTIEEMIAELERVAKEDTIVKVEWLVDESASNVTVEEESFLEEIVSSDERAIEEIKTEDVVTDMTDDVQEMHWDDPVYADTSMDDTITIVTVMEADTVGSDLTKSSTVDSDVQKVESEEVLESIRSDEALVDMSEVSSHTFALDSEDDVLTIPPEVWDDLHEPIFVVDDSPESQALVRCSSHRVNDVPLFNVGMTFRPLSVVSSLDLFGTSLAHARSSRRHVEQVVSFWSHELFYQSSLKDDAAIHATVSNAMDEFRSMATIWMEEE